MMTICALFATSAAPATAQHASHEDIIDVAKQAGAFGTLLAALDAAHLTDALEGDGPFTVFAPTDDAFAALPDGTVESLLERENRDKLAAILKYHVVPGTVSAAEASKLRFAGTLNGQRVGIRAEAGRLEIDDATVVTADVRASNGVIHVIDQVLLPQDENIVDVAAGAGNFGTLLAAATAAGLAEALTGEGPFTVLAPTDDAFAALPDGTVESLLEEENLAQLAEILKLHVVPSRVYADQALEAGSAKTLNGASVRFQLADGGLRVNGTSIIAANIEATNGVIHVIDEVLLPRTVGDEDRRAIELIRLAIDRGVPLFNRG
ncbi:MAG: fasciclin domain-containing protein, partial [Gemmatimonadota bacterium]|nr:fasciclin domain-containing protein [Gemmatimonadota bacterium]